MRGDFPGGPVVKNLPCNAGDLGSIPGWSTKIPCATEQLSLCGTKREVQMMQQRTCVLPQGPRTVKTNILKKNMIKDTDEPPDGRDAQERCVGSSVELPYPLQACHSPWKLSKPYLLGFPWRLYHTGLSHH